jgi:23S rRNA (cytidine2498-2'-O)-methyltransferase
VTRAILTCSPYFDVLALNEARRHHPQIAAQLLIPGYYLLDAPCAFDQLTAPWRSRLPIYLYHCFPVDEVLSLDVDGVGPLNHALNRLARSGTTVQLRSLIEAGQPYSLTHLQTVLGERWTRPCLQPAPASVVSVLVAPDADGVRAYLGTSPAAHNLSPWPGGQIPITEPVSNRAGYKLIEALDAFAIRLRRGDHALDLGASPGAWTTLLRRRQLRVTAVAPAPLYPWLTFDRDVIHQAMRAEDYLSRCTTTFDLIVNDMKLDPQDSARVMVDYAAHLRSEGIAIMTLKLREGNEPRVMDHSYRILRRAYKIIRVRHLVSNRQEITLFLRRHA